MSGQVTADSLTGQIINSGNSSKKERSRSEYRSRQRNPIPSRSKSFDSRDSRIDKFNHGEVHRPKECICGPNIYGNILGPTVDEQILAGLAALFKICDDCPPNQHRSEIKDDLSQYAGSDYSGEPAEINSGERKLDRMLAGIPEILPVLNDWSSSHVQSINESYTPDEFDDRRSSTATKGSETSFERSQPASNEDDDQIADINEGEQVSGKIIDNRVLNHSASQTLESPLQSSEFQTDGTGELIVSHAEEIGVCPCKPFNNTCECGKNSSCDSTTALCISPRSHHSHHNSHHSSIHASSHQTSSPHDSKPKNQYPFGYHGPRISDHGSTHETYHQQTPHHSHHANASHRSHHSNIPNASSHHSSSHDSSHHKTQHHSPNHSQHANASHRSHHSNIPYASSHHSSSHDSSHHKTQHHSPNHEESPHSFINDHSQSKHQHCVGSKDCAKCSKSCHQSGQNKYSEGCPGKDTGKRSESCCCDSRTSTISTNELNHALKKSALKMGKTNHCCCGNEFVDASTSDTKDSTTSSSCLSCKCVSDFKTTISSSISCSGAASTVVSKKCCKKKTDSCKCKNRKSKSNPCVHKKVTLCKCTDSTTSTAVSDSAAIDVAQQQAGDSTNCQIRYAITKITKFSSYTTFEVMKSTRKKPKVMPTTLEGVFVLRNKKCS